MICDYSLEQVILSNLIQSEGFARKAVPFIKPDYFETPVERIISKEILSFYNEYNKPPTQKALAIQISNNRKNLSESTIIEIEQYINNLNFIENNETWLINNTEKFCKDKAVLKAIVDSFDIIEGRNPELTRDAIPSLLQEALRVSFDSSVGHDYIEDFQSRYNFYHKQDDKIPFDIDLLNKITRGGLSRKTLNLILSPPKAGKTMLMCHMASAALLKGYNVLYITLEMAEERIAERIDANLLDVDIAELESLDLEIFNSRMNKLTNKTKGRLMIKEYPTTSGHAGHFKALIEELKIKKNFLPDIIVIDYLNICASSRMKQGGAVNSYTYMKSIAEELRGLAIEYNLPIISAAQVNRQNSQATDLEMDSVSDSHGIIMTVDLLIALIRTEELDGLNQSMIKQIANRYNDINYYKRFMIGRNANKMRFYDVENSAQSDVADKGYSDDSGPVFDKSSFGGNGRGRSVDTGGFKF